MTKFVNSPLSATLGLLGFLVAGPSALATWYAADTGKKMIPLASIPVGGSGVTVFARDTSSLGLYEVWYQGGQWNTSLVYNQPNAWAVAASATYVKSPVSPLLNLYFVAHVDFDGQVRLTSWSFLNGWTTLPNPVDSGTQWPRALATVVFPGNGNLYIFYASANGGTNSLKCSIYNGRSISTQTLDGGGYAPPGFVAGSMHDPAAVTAPDGLHVYYFDSNHGTLREAYSPDGVIWTRFQSIDGAGAQGQNNTPVGALPAAIVRNDGMTWMINVFYSDLSTSDLWTAELLPGGKWWIRLVFYINPLTAKAPLIHQGGLQVYYETNMPGQIQVAYTDVYDNCCYILALDGADSTGIWSDAAYGAVQHQIAPYVTAVEANGTAPSVFYVDSATGTMRNAYWQ